MKVAFLGTKVKEYSQPSGLDANAGPATHSNTWLHNSPLGRARVRNPATADERERRIVEYLRSVHQGRIAEFKLTRLNKLANLRKRLKDLLDEIVETRAEDLAAGMLMEYAPPRPEPLQRSERGTVTEGRLPVPPKSVRPVWLEDSVRGRMRVRK